MDDSMTQEVHAETLQELVERGLSKYAKSIALVCDNEEITFSGLEKRSRALARRLVASRINQKPLVAVCSHRSFDLYAAILAPVLLGGAYLPLSPDEPQVRLDSMIARARPAAVLTTESLRSRFVGFDGPVIVVDVLDDGPLVRGPANEVSSSMDPAYVIFTSGSTGQPKGAVIPNRAIVNRLVWMARAFSITGEDVLMQKTPVTFDVSLWEIFLPYLTGARVIIPRPAGEHDLAYISRLVKERHVTVIHYVPSVLVHYLEVPQVQGESQSLRLIVASGEALSTKLRDLCLDRIPSPSLYNLYGPTEAAVDVTWWKCSVDDQYRTVPIGRPIDNVALYVLDDNFHPVAAGEQGELFIGEVAVGSGYLNDPERTSASFVRDIIADAPGRMMYRTGDIVTVDEDGVLEFVGRRDFQVKIRGNRVELGEVESALLATGMVRDCAALVATDSSDEPIVRAYAVAGRPHLRESDCLVAMRRLVPGYLVPSELVFIDKLPLTTHGKVDRARLSELGSSRSKGSDPVPARESAPSDDVVEVIHSIWCDLLGRTEVACDVSHFDAGGTSLSILRMPGVIQERLGVQVTVTDLFKYPTIAQLAAYLQTEGR